MRRRPGSRTIRTRILALVLIPVVVLVSLWTFAVVSVTGELRDLIRLQAVYVHYGTPVDTTVGQIQVERRLSAAYLASGSSRSALADLTGQQRHTDEVIAAMRAAIGDRGERGDLSAGQSRVLTRALAAVDRLPALRRDVIAGRIDWARAVDRYTDVVLPTFEVQTGLTALQNGQLAREAQNVAGLVRVREFVSHEDALVTGGRVAGGFTTDRFRRLAATIEDRRVFQRTYVPALPADSRALFREFERGPLYRSLVEGEDALLRAGATGTGKVLVSASWRRTMDDAVRRYMLLCTDAAKNAAARGRDFARRELLYAGAAGGAGLLGVGLSLWFSVHTGRRITRRLEELRDAADTLAVRQLPEVTRRLGAGEQVDVAAEAPPLAFGRPEDDGCDGAGPDEIGQVGRALNAARRAAVEAAVRQADLRRAMSALFLNIARRNQALVHRQLKLVDTLERRTSDPDALAELFRIDHLTTRMRRHAEGLIILSGAAPGRVWRKPVPIVDVVGAAVGEVEEYARVVVPPMPEVGVVGEAVVDLIHLIAELVENATVFSPPRTQVTMRVGEAAHGFALEIDDRGLGMDADELEQANATLRHAEDFDPARSERLGLYVVGRLAHRHGVEVTLTRSPFGGTTAVVFLPGPVLAPVTAGPGTESGPGPGPVATAAGARAVTAGSAPGDGAAAEPTGPLPRRRREPATGAVPGPAPAVPTAPGTGAAPALPTRVRQANLAPQLRAGANDPGAGREVSGAGLSPEQMGAIFGAFQRGLDRGRDGAGEGGAAT
ncbi:nitrate- and nitrite sensing domain-containing protein [Streptomyces sp. PA03-6a]|nr:nitrate- and nitrite sensing domain-containing protein [Streptomyces sp. PA03-6a]